MSAVLEALGRVFEHASVAFGAAVEDPRVAVVTWTLVADVTAAALVLVGSASALLCWADVLVARDGCAVRR